MRYATADLSARASSDYRAAAGTLTFAPGETAKTLRIELTGDAAAAPKRFAVLLFDGTVPFTKAAGVGWLGGEAATALTLDDASGAEGTTLYVPIRLTRPATQPITVRYATIDGTATAPDDYAAASGTITFAPGQVERTIAVATVRRDTFDPPKTFFILLSDANVPLERSAGVCTIFNIPPRRRATR